MAENYKKVVNLQSKQGGFSEQNDFTHRPSFAQPMAQTQKKAKSRAEEIDKVYAENDGMTEKKDFGKIDRPAIRTGNEKFYKILASMLVLAILAAIVFVVLDKTKDNKESESKDVVQQQEGRWYSVQLASGETYYGYIKDTAADPIVLEKVFYNYDQINKKEGETPAEENTNSSIRLVKRGKESHGPDGTMNVVRSQALYLEPLSDDSKILKAILEYEKQ